MRLSWTWSWARAKRRIRAALVLLLAIGVGMIVFMLPWNAVPNRLALFALPLLFAGFAGIALLIRKQRPRGQHAFEHRYHRGQRKVPESWEGTPIELAHKVQPEQLVATVELRRGKIRLNVFDKRYKAELKELFSRPLYRLMAGGRLLDGGYWDAGEMIKPSDPRFLEAVFDKLCHRFEIRW
jgi:hypothetical protein